MNRFVVDVILLISSIDYVFYLLTSRLKVSNNFQSRIKNKSVKFGLLMYMELYHLLLLPFIDRLRRVRMDRSSTVNHDHL